MTGFCQETRATGSWARHRPPFSLELAEGLKFNHGYQPSGSTWVFSCFFSWFREFWCLGVHFTNKSVAFRDQFGDQKRDGPDSRKGLADEGMTPK